MSLSSRDKNRIVDRINTAIMKLGFTNNTLIPPAKDNRGPIAVKLWVAYHLASFATKYKESAEWEAVQAGVIPDKEKAPLPPGKHGAIYDDGVVSVGLEVRNPSTRVDAKKLVAILEEAGIPRKVLDEAMRQATNTGRGAHVFTPTLNVDFDFDK